MSRTIRRLPMHRTSRTVKWYGAAFSHADYQLLKNPPPRVNTDRIYVQKTKTDTHTVYELSKKGVPGAKYLEWDDWWLSTKGIRQGDWYITRREEYTRTWRERVWSPNMWRVDHPNPNQDAIDEWRDYLCAHRYAFRNKTCRRQRKNAVRHAKMAASRARRIEDRQIIQQELEYWRCDLAEDMG